MNKVKLAVTRAGQATATTVGFTIVNVLFVIVEILGLLVQNPLPVIKPEYVPYLIFAQAALNVIIRRFFLDDNGPVGS